MSLTAFNPLPQIKWRPVEHSHPINVCSLVNGRARSGDRLGSGDLITLNDSFLFRRLLLFSAATDAVTTATVTQSVEQVDGGVLHTENPFNTQLPDRSANPRLIKGDRTVTEIGQQDEEDDTSVTAAEAQSRSQTLDSGNEGTAGGEKREIERLRSEKKEF
ncbi:hypothetical protein Baya_6211 [Bagarius yarrelli]|uniref:Uncharacterized protein n=1 Tax=Bagarius yarrelli TaxID=175774 RepID=A0A556TZY9_BAGYA|nr:hypothetical protein Baya_6211 [Bagarius yarrelli]